MLQLRPNCECCDRDLAPDAAGAMICTFECTFCRDCAETRFAGVCPNCGGGLVARPVRPTALLARAPGSVDRVRKSHQACI
ncbi:MAG: DUF1272 domain-containing protein [Caulobacter sp.]|nr:DUF1272 domain-containing protein [Caulobacter sp.]